MVVTLSIPRFDGCNTWHSCISQITTCKFEYFPCSQVHHPVQVILPVEFFFVFLKSSYKLSYHYRNPWKSTWNLSVLIKQKITPKIFSLNWISFNWYPRSPCAFPCLYVRTLTIIPLRIMWNSQFIRLRGNCRLYKRFNPRYVFPSEDLMWHHVNWHKWWDAIMSYRGIN